MPEIASMDRSGDTKMIWDRNNPDEIEIARAAYDKWKKKGGLIFAVKDKEGNKGEQLTAFDPNAERMIMVPQMVGG